jgi:hypothetical protein
MTQLQFFDGATFEPALDAQRLMSQLERVRALMSDGQWRTLGEIQAACGGTEASCSARGRDFRKKRFGEHDWQRRRVIGGLYEYRLVLKQ